jgi:hypothetical protein
MPEIKCGFRIFSDRFRNCFVSGAGGDPSDASYTAPLIGSLECPDRRWHVQGQSIGRMSRNWNARLLDEAIAAPGSLRR